MTECLKEFVRARPTLYDRLIRAYRGIWRKSYPSYRFFDAFSVAHSRKVTFIQIGASDGLHNDPIREFVIRDKWIGIKVEPLPTSFSRLKQNCQTIANRGLVFVNAAITSSVEGDSSF